MSTFHVTFSYTRTDGPTVEREEVAAGLAEALEGIDFEAGDEPSVFEVTDVKVHDD